MAEEIIKRDDKPQQVNYGIYKITNIITGQMYIGQSNNIKRRWQEHKVNYKKYNTNLYQAMRDFGLENFTFEVLESCIDQKELIEKEQYYINFYNSIENGYNMRIDNNTIKTIPYEIINKIKMDLKNLEFSQFDIAKKYAVSPSLVNLINSGKMHYDEKISYPIRPMQEPKRHNYCIDCGEEIGLKSCRCTKCFSISQRKAIRPDRETLKNLIRTKSFREIGKDYNVTDNAIRKWCDFEKLPRTKRDINSYSNEEWEQI